MNFQKVFNSTFYEFLDDLIATYPDESDLPAMRSVLDWTIKMMGDQVPQEMFHVCVAIPYGEKISTKNESFFLEECNYDNQYADINIVNKLKARWRTLTDKNKEIVWKYLFALMALNQRCNAIRDDAASNIK